MSGKIILISNTYPLRGEPFLGTELSLLEEKWTVYIWPFFANKSDKLTEELPKNVDLHFFQARVNSATAMLRAIKSFFAHKEFKACWNRRGRFLNILKGLKFAYISEKRIPEIANFIRDNNTEEYILYSYWMYEDAYVAARIKQVFPMCKFVTRCHGYDLYPERHQNGYLPFRDFIMYSADLICPISQSGYDFLNGEYAGRYTEKTRISRLGTIKLYEDIKKEKSEEKIQIVSCSNVVAVKRLERLIDALMEIKIPIHWHHFGDGDLLDNVKVCSKRLPSNVETTFHGRVPNSEIQKFYATETVDVFVNVSESEGIPVSIMEAQCYGIPVIATDVGGTSEIVHNGENGVLLNVEFSDEDLLTAIDEVVEKAESYRAAAFRTWQTMSDAHVVFPEFYEKLAEV